MATAASLLSLTLDPTEELVMAGEDLKDYYYFFKTPPARLLRNVITGKLPRDVAASFAGFSFAEDGHSFYYAALNTLPMGDLNAVSYGQTAHVSLLLSHTDVHLSELLTLDSRPPRGGFATGICIDDFVCLEKRPRGTGPPRTDFTRYAWDAPGLRWCWLGTEREKGLRGSHQGELLGGHGGWRKR